MTKNRKPYPKRFIGDSVALLPDFCWMTFDEVLAYLEQVEPRLEWHSLARYLKLGVERGWIEVKETGRAFDKTGRLVVRSYRGLGKAKD